MTDYTTIKIEKADFVTTVSLNRPDKKNAMNPTMHREMSAALEELAYDDETRVLVVTGVGNSFCGGMDLKETFYDLESDPAEFRRVTKAAEWRSHQLRRFPKPTIAAVNGYCFGGGFTIVGSCDIVIAAEDATFGLSEINFGKIAGGYVSKSLSENINPRHALYYILTGEQFDGKRAVEINLATEAVPREQLLTRVAELCDVLKAKNPLVARYAKEAFQQVRTMDWEQAGSWLNSQSQALDHASGTTWKTGVEQFKSGEFKPGEGHYVWQR